MTWLRIDDGMVDHRKWAALESDPRTWAECLAVWVALASYCQRTLSDGHVPESRLARLTPLGPKAKARCDDLVRVGLMDRVEDGYLFHDWLVYQASREKVEERREAKTRRQDRWRKSDGSFGDARVDASTRASHDASRDARVATAPSHPIPSHPILLSSKASDAREPDPGSGGPRSEPTPVAGESLTQRAERVRVTLRGEYQRRGLVVPTMDLSVPHSGHVLDLTRAFDGRGDLGSCLDGFFSDDRAAAAGFPVAWLAKNPNAYLAKRPRNAKNPRANSEYRDRVLTMDELLDGAGGSDG